MLDGSDYENRLQLLGNPRRFCLLYLKSDLIFNTIYLSFHFISVRRSCELCFSCTSGLQGHLSTVNRRSAAVENACAQAEARAGYRSTFLRETRIKTTVCHVNVTAVRLVFNLRVYSNL